MDGFRFPIGIECGASMSCCAGSDAGGELVSDPGGLTARKADMGLVPNGPSPWKVERLPYVCWTSLSPGLVRRPRRDPTSPVSGPAESTRCGMEGLKKSSSTPMNLELSRDSESSILKLQSFLYVTDVHRRPTGTSRSPNM